MRKLLQILTTTFVMLICFSRMSFGMDRRGREERRGLSAERDQHLSVSAIARVSAEAIAESQRLSALAIRASKRSTPRSCRKIRRNITALQEQIAALQAANAELRAARPVEVEAPTLQRIKRRVVKRKRKKRRRSPEYWREEARKKGTKLRALSEQNAKFSSRNKILKKTIARLRRQLAGVEAGNRDLIDENRSLRGDRGPHFRRIIRENFPLRTGELELLLGKFQALVDVCRPALDAYDMSMRSATSACAVGSGTAASGAACAVGAADYEDPFARQVQPGTALLFERVIAGCLRGLHVLKRKMRALGLDLDKLTDLVGPPNKGARQ